MNCEYAYNVLRVDYELNDDNVGETRRVLSFGDEYSEYIKNEAQIVIESINLGQSTLSLGELLNNLHRATHKLSTLGNEIALPGAEHFRAAAKIAGEALEYIKSIAETTEEFASCALSCDETVDASYL